MLLAEGDNILQNGEDEKERGQKRIIVTENTGVREK